MSEWPEKLNEKIMDMGEMSEEDFVKTCKWHEEREKTLDCIPRKVLEQIKTLAPGLVIPEIQEATPVKQLAILKPKQEQEPRVKKQRVKKEETQPVPEVSADDLGW